MGDVVIRIGEGIATILAFLGASAIIVAVVAIFFPVLAVLIAVCILGPLTSPLGAIWTSCSFAGASKESVRRAERQLEKRRRNLEQSTENLENSERDRSLARAELDETEQVPDAPSGRFQFWGRLHRSKQRFDNSRRQRRFENADQRQKQAKRKLELSARAVIDATAELQIARRSRKRRLFFHTLFTTTIVAVVLWALYLLPPP